MKNLKYIWLLCLALTAVCFASCDDDDNQDSKPIVITKIYLEDYKSAVRPPGTVDPYRGQRFPRDEAGLYQRL